MFEIREEFDSDGQRGRRMIGVKIGATGSCLFGMGGEGGRVDRPKCAGDIVDLGRQ